jgi:hypothetical protein
MRLDPDETEDLRLGNEEVSFCFPPQNCPLPIEPRPSSPALPQNYIGKKLLTTFQFWETVRPTPAGTSNSIIQHVAVNSIFQ